MEQQGTIHEERIVMLTVALNAGTASFEVDNGIGFMPIPLDATGVQNVFVRPCRYRIITTGAAVVGIS